MQIAQINENSWMLSDLVSREMQLEFDYKARLIEADIRFHLSTTDTPVYDQMQAYFWFQRFMQMSYQELDKLSKSLGYKGRGKKDVLVANLTAHFAAITKVRGI